LDSRNKDISSCICTSCGEGFPLKSTLGIAAEVERMASYRLPPGTVRCRNEACANHCDRVAVGTAGAYASFGKIAIGNPRWRVCGKTFSHDARATARQREHRKNKAIFKLLINKMPVRRIIEVAGIDPNTFYRRRDFLHRQCQAFAAHRERALANLVIRRLYLGVDRRDYLVNRLVRKDKRNIQRSAIAAVDNEHGYCFGVRLNFNSLPHPHPSPFGIPRRSPELWSQTGIPRNPSRGIEGEGKTGEADCVDHLCDRQ
jgi:hypothetical protein